MRDPLERLRDIHEAITHHDLPRLKSSVQAILTENT